MWDIADKSVSDRFMGVYALHTLLARERGAPHGDWNRKVVNNNNEVGYYK